MKANLESIPYLTKQFRPNGNHPNLISTDILSCTKDYMPCNEGCLCFVGLFKMHAQQEHSMKSWLSVIAACNANIAAFVKVFGTCVQLYKKGVQVIIAVIQLYSLHRTKLHTFLAPMEKKKIINV